MAKMIIKRVGVLSIAKIEALIAAVFGLIIGVFYGMFFALLSAAMSSSSSGNSVAVGGMGLAAVFIFPIVYGILGFIAGAIGALIYNFAAGFLGGVELELENAGQAYGAPPPQTYQNPYGAPYGGSGPPQ